MKNRNINIPEFFFWHYYGAIKFVPLEKAKGCRSFQIDLINF